MNKPLLFSAWNAMNSTMVLVFIFVLLAAVLLHFALYQRRWVKKTRSVLTGFKNWTSLLLRVITGLVLFAGSFLGFLFAPDMAVNVLQMNLRTVLLAIQLLIGLGLAIGIFPRFMSALGFTLYLFAMFIFPFLQVLSWIMFAGIFVYLFICGDPFLPKVRSVKIFPNLVSAFELENAKPYAMAFLRAASAFSFIFSGFVFHIYHPEYMLQLCLARGLNFMPSIGFAGFSDDMFVLAFGLVQILFGLVILLGVLPRFTGGILFIALTWLLVVFGIYAFLGHLPLYAVAFALLANGGGQKWSAELLRTC